MAELLRVEDLRAGYGEAVVLQGVSLALDQGQTLALLGRNGTGKTTLINTVAGATRQHGGTLEFNVGQRRVDLSRLPSFERAACGIGWVPQERNIFKSLTVHENLTAVARPGPWTPQAVYTLFPRLAERRTNRGDQLSGGEQQMLAIGRALLTNPQLLILDEPTEGLAPLIVIQIRKVLRSLRGSGLTIVIVDQNLETVFSIADHVALISRGTVVAEGPTEKMANDHSLLNQYLGV